MMLKNLSEDSRIQQLFHNYYTRTVRPQKFMSIRQSDFVVLGYSEADPKRNCQGDLMHF